MYKISARQILMIALISGIFAAGAIHYKQSLRHTNLDCGESDAWRGIHRLKHVAYEFRQVGVKLGNRIRGIIEHGSRPSHNFQ